MKYVLTAIVFIVIFSVVILLHELGHFIAAKRSGVKVEEFGIGLPPRIWGKKKGETIYSVNWIPFGGFVRLLGEAGDGKILKNKRSLVSQSMRTRAKIAVSGVLMNFLLAWILLSVCFTAGMEPLLAPDDILPAVDSGVIQLQEGLKIKEVSAGGFFDSVGFENDDLIYSINGKTVDDYIVSEISLDPAAIYDVLRDGSYYTYEITEDQVPENFTEIGPGVEFYNFVSFPRVKIFDVNKASKSYAAGLRAGDFIVTINENNVFGVSDYEDLTRGETILNYEVFRDGMREPVTVELDQSRRIIVSDVMPGTPAEKVGLMAGDVIVSVNGAFIDDSQELIDFVEEHADETLAYLIERNGERLFYEIVPENGKIGVYLSELINYSDEQNITLYNVDLLSSILEIKDTKYPWYVSIYKSFGEGVRLTVLTGKMIGGFVSGLISRGEVPSTVTGPIGIATLTYVFVGEGFIPVLRFVALLSLSLAVINILPFPALDGGRLLFVFVELIIGRRINAKWEAMIHALGYVIILFLILAVTYGDIMRLIGG
ncbi:MAG: RIP metalloprotease RseP [Candidatus Peregrinibacteria bacterium]